MEEVADGGRAAIYSRINLSRAGQHSPGNQHQLEITAGRLWLCAVVRRAEKRKIQEGAIRALLLLAFKGATRGDMCVKA